MTTSLRSLSTARLRQKLAGAQASKRQHARGTPENLQRAVRFVSDIEAELQRRAKKLAVAKAGD